MTPWGATALTTTSSLFLREKQNLTSLKHLLNYSEPGGGQGFTSLYVAKKCRSVRCSVVSDSLRPHGLQPVRHLCPWNSPGKNAGVGSHSILQENLPDPRIKPRSPAWQTDSLRSETPGKPMQRKPILTNMSSKQN